MNNVEILNHDPDAIVRAMRRAIARKERQPMGAVSAALKAAASSSISLPTLAICSRDRVEAEMLARRRADENRRALLEGRD